MHTVLLLYMENTTEENAKSDAIKRIHHMVKNVKKERQVSIEYMRMCESNEELIRQGQDMERANTEKERQRANKAEALAAAEKTRAEQEKTRAEQAEERVAELEKLLRQYENKQ